VVDLLCSILEKRIMDTLSDEQVHDLSQAYDAYEIIDILDIESEELISLLRRRVARNIKLFDLRPVDCND
jgi:hypothetical protein